jgi:hypothetical protein
VINSSVLGRSTFRIDLQYQIFLLGLKTHS